MMEFLEVTRDDLKQEVAHCFPGTYSIRSKRVLLVNELSNEPAGLPYPMAQEEAVAWNKNAYESPRLSFGFGYCKCYCLALKAC